MEILIAIAIILLVAAVISYVINAFLPIDVKIKQLLQLLIWAVAIIAILYRVSPLLGF